MKLLTFLIAAFFPFSSWCQVDTTVYKLYKNRQALEYRLNREVINKKLSLPLTDSTEEDWEDAFFALQYLNRTDPWSDGKIKLAVTDMNNRSEDFARALLEILYARYPGKFRKEISAYLPKVENEKVWAMAAEYLLASANPAEKKELERLARKQLAKNPASPFFLSFANNFKHESISCHELASLFSKNYLPGNVLMISVQRKNRDQPGLVLVRDSAGNFLKDSSGKIFHVPQLARSLNGLPGYLTNGNTPAGVLRMDGFDVSKAGAIGPTQNVQLTLPLEYNALHFLRDSSLTDTVLQFKDYLKLLPEELRGKQGLHQAFYAGQAGRHEIIAHGTTVKPEYYAGKPYYPFTPTLGCLCTYETWNDADQMRQVSHQQLLIDALKRAGGPFGYAIVFELNDDESPVKMEEVMPLLQKAGNE